MKKIDNYVILNIILAELKLSKIHLENKSRKRCLLDTKYIAIYLIRKYTSLTLVQIGVVFKMHHSTILHAVSVVENMIKYENNTENIKNMRKILKYLKVILNNFFDVRWLDEALFHSNEIDKKKEFKSFQPPVYKYNEEENYEEYEDMTGEDY